MYIYKKNVDCSVFVIVLESVVNDSFSNFEVHSCCAIFKLDEYQADVKYATVWYNFSTQIVRVMYNLTGKKKWCYTYCLSKAG